MSHLNYDWLQWLLLCAGGVIGIFVYLLPSVVAGLRSHRNVPALLALNLLLGWTIIGWVAALVWALYRSEGTERPRITRIET